ncbi:MAG TPA: type ISP restriction/modification enzyme [Pirellulaceae bacterium]|nr:type ISP restriction/modification enzyme [Pirellulaceae bacterium]
MTVPGAIKPTHKAIRTYREALDAYAGQGVTHEGATETAFQRLLEAAAKTYGWALVPKLPVKHRGKNVVPDGTVRDANFLQRGYWEAKDTDDDLEVEIRKKIAKGYPLTNIIFDDTTRAVLYQDGKESMRVDLREPQLLVDLLNAFFEYTEPNIQGFVEAVDEFKERVPELAAALAEIIRKAHDDNKKFQAAFDKFFTLCQSALNPNIRREAVDEMLVQHLLTERLFRKIFNNPEFTRRNVIAAEVEEVISALAIRSFNREAFLKQLDRFYVAIEEAARTLEDFSDKQKFLNTVYERFFQGYSVKVADTHGIVYTPQQIVDFMCASVAEVLEKEFGKSLGDKEVHILDPCTGTGNFIVNLINRIPRKDLPRMYRQQLFANEVMLLPYYIAALNIEHAYFEKTGEYEPFEGLCFVDTLDLAEKRQSTFGFLNEENTQRVERQRKAPITVIIGNPPYNMGQLNENDNNKNRTYAVVDDRIRRSYVAHSKATLNNKVYDPYVRFFRWACDRLERRDGIVCLITNNSFVDQAAFDGMRQCLADDFSRIYHLNLQGNVRHNPTLAGSAYNVFGIQVGVGITVAVKRSSQRSKKLFYHALPLTFRRFAKLDWLSEHSNIAGVKWLSLKSDEKNTWLTSDRSKRFEQFLPLGSKAAKAGVSDDRVIFRLFSLGASTNRDDVVYDFQREQLEKKATEFAEQYNREVDRFRRRKSDVRSIDDFVDYRFVKWSSTLKDHLKRLRYAEFEPRLIRDSMYRPFAKQFLCYGAVFVDRPALFAKILPDRKSEQENRVIIVPTVAGERGFFTFACSMIPNLNFVGFGGAGQCFPYYDHVDDGDRRENITDWALNEFRKHYKDKKISKWNLFDYVYGILHHPGYREKYADNLKRELPRIPYAPDFAAFSHAGQKLARLHLEYEQLKEWKLKWIEAPDVPLSYRVEKMKLAKDKKSLRVNDWLTLDGIPPETFDYRLGNRSALEWVIDQYQVSEDPRSGIKSDPNRADDPEYIVRLVGQVVRVSVETVEIIKSLPVDCGG